MKKIASLIMTVVTLVIMMTVLAVPALAGSQTIDGSDVTWKLTEDNTKLILGGKGAMPDFYNNGMEDRPWSDAISTITTVEIASGVTSIGKSAFFNFEKLSSVAIPYGVTEIGTYAFTGCKSLKDINLPSSVTSINSYVFEDCRALSSVTIPSGVTSIGTMAFSGCTSLTSVTIPSGVTSIGMMAFYSTGLLNLTIKASTPPTLGALSLPSSNADFAIYVPCGTGDTYRNADGWSKYSQRIQEEYDVTGSVFSEGNLWIIFAMAVAAVSAIAVLIIVKKKKQPVLECDE